MFTINNKNFNSVVNNALLKSSEKTQYIRALKTFSGDVIVQTMVVNGSVGDINIEKGSLLTLHTNQTIAGHVIVEGALYSEVIAVTRKIYSLLF